MIEPKGVVHFSIAVSDLDASQRFYTGLLGLTLVHAAPAIGMVFLRAGDDYVILAKSDAPLQRNPKDSRRAHHLESYATNGTGTVRGGKDRDKEIQIDFWQRAAKEGFTDERARASAQKFRVAFDALDHRLAQHPYLMGDNLSVLDIAWLI